MTKSHVTLEQKQCPVCGKVFDSGALLLDRRLKPVFEMHTVTGHALCPDDEKKNQDGYIALVVCDESKSAPAGSTMKLQDAHRTGEVIHMRRTAAARVFNVPMTGPMAFINQDAAQKIKDMAGHE